MLKKTLDEEPDFRAFSLHGKLRNIGGVADVSVGRMPYFVGVGNGILDGALTTVRFAGNSVRFSLYGGARVPDDLSLSGWKSLSTNFVLGTQIVTTTIKDARIGISFVNRQRERAPYWTVRPDSLFNPVSAYIVPEALKEQLLSIDGEYLISDLRFYGRYDHDLNGSRTQRAQIGLRYAVSEDISVTGDFIHRAPRVSFNSFFSVFDVSSINEFEAGVDYRFLPSFRAFLRGALVDYEDENSFRTTIGVAHGFVSLTYRGSTGYAGELHSVNLQGSYPLLERKVVPNAALSFGKYRLSDNVDFDDVLSFAIGTTVRPIRTLSVDLQAQALNNTIVQNDVRFFGKLTFWFAEHLSIID
jgi:hypothetical protein